MLSFVTISDILFLLEKYTEITNGMKAQVILSFIISFYLNLLN